MWHQPADINHKDSAMKPVSKKRGFSMIEVLLGIFMAGACATILSSTMPVATQSRAKADMSNKATSIAQKQLERVVSLGYSNITPAKLSTEGLIDSVTAVSTNTYAFTNSDSASADSVGNALPDSTGTVSIEQVDTNLKRVIVNITYRAGKNTRSVSIGTIIANI